MPVPERVVPLAHALGHRHCVRVKKRQNVVAWSRRRGQTDGALSKGGRGWVRHERAVRGSVPVDGRTDEQAERPQGARRRSSRSSCGRRASTLPWFGDQLSSRFACLRAGLLPEGRNVFRSCVLLLLSEGRHPLWHQLLPVGRSLHRRFPWVVWVSVRDDLMRQRCQPQVLLCGPRMHEWLPLGVNAGHGNGLCERDDVHDVDDDLHPTGRLVWQQPRWLLPHNAFRQQAGLRSQRRQRLPLRRQQRRLHDRQRLLQWCLPYPRQLLPTGRGGRPVRERRRLRVVLPAQPHL